MRAELSGVGAGGAGPHEQHARATSPVAPTTADTVVAGCSAVPCPLDSTGPDIPSGCTCDAGYNGAVTGLWNPEPPRIPPPLPSRVCCGVTAISPCTPDRAG